MSGCAAPVRRRSPPDHRQSTPTVPQNQQPFPLGPLLDTLRDIGTGISAGGPLSPVTGALRPLLPELAGQLPPAPEPPEERAAERHRVFRALSELLGSLGEAVLVLEDLHWADEQTLAFLGYLADVGAALRDPGDGGAAARARDADPGWARMGA